MADRIIDLENTVRSKEKEIVQDCINLAELQSQLTESEKLSNRLAVLLTEECELTTKLKSRLITARNALARKDKQDD